MEKGCGCFPPPFVPRRSVPPSRISALSLAWATAVYRMFPWQRRPRNNRVPRCLGNIARQVGAFRASAVATKHLVGDRDQKSNHRIEKCFPRSLRACWFCASDVYYTGSSSCRCWSLGAVGPSCRSDYSGRGSSSRWPWNYGGMDLARQQLAWQQGFLSAIRRGYCRVLVLLQTPKPP